MRIVRWVYAGIAIALGLGALFLATSPQPEQEPTPELVQLGAALQVLESHGYKPYGEDECPYIECTGMYNAERDTHFWLLSDEHSQLTEINIGVFVDANQVDAQMLEVDKILHEIFVRDGKQIAETVLAIPWQMEPTATTSQGWKIGGRYNNEKLLWAVVITQPEK